MKTTKTFPAGTTLQDLANHVRIAADEITGETGEEAIPVTVRITVETFSIELSVSKIASALLLGNAVEAIERFIAYRRDELRKPIKSDAQLRRLLSQFHGDGDALRAAVDNSIRQSWTGLFNRGSGSTYRSREFQSEGDSKGGKF